MGLFSFIKRKVETFKATIKQKNLQKVMSKAELKKENLTIIKASNGMQVLSKGSNFEAKSGFFEDVSTEHFASSMAHKTLKDVVDYVKNISNFADVSTLEKKIAAYNRRRKQASNNASSLTIDGLFQYFSGGQSKSGEGALSEADVKVYSSIAKKSQARARALAYIKANFIGICNMRDLANESSQNGNEQFKELMNVVKEYCDEDINGFALPQFDSETINNETLNSNDNYLKGATFAQRRCDDILLARITEEQETLEKLSNIDNTVLTNIDKYDQNITNIAELNKKINNLDNSLQSFQTVESKLLEASKYYENQVDTQGMYFPWIRNKKDINKKCLSRQNQLVAEFQKMAQDFGLFDFSSNADGSIEELAFFNYQNGGSSNPNIDSQNNEDFYIFDRSLPPFEAFANAVSSYKNDSSVEHDNDIFRVKTDIVEKDGKTIQNSFIYTDRQEIVLKEIYNSLVEYAQDSINSEEFKDGSNPLVNFAYINKRHSIPDVQLKKLANILFGSNITKGQKINSNFANLSANQLKALNEFIYSNEPVKNFLRKNNLLTDYEVDRQLLEQFNPELTDENDCKLNIVMAFMQNEAIKHEQDRIDQIENDTKNERIKATKERQEQYDSAKSSLSSFEKMKDDISKIADKEVPTKSKKPIVKDADINNKHKNVSLALVEKILSAQDLPDSPEKISDKSTKLSTTRTSKSHNAPSLRQKVQDIIASVKKTADSVFADKNSYSSANNAQRANYYKRYFTSADTAKVSEYMQNIVATINQIKSAEKENASTFDEDEREL